MDIEAAKGIITARDKTKLFRYGGTILVDTPRANNVWIAFGGFMDNRVVDCVQVFLVHISLAFYDSFIKWPLINDISDN